MTEEYFIKNTFICTFDERFEHKLRRTKSCNDILLDNDSKFEIKNFVIMIRQNLSDILYDKIIIDINSDA